MSYTCKHCGMTSHNENDARERFCGACQRFEDSSADSMPDLTWDDVRQRIDAVRAAIDARVRALCEELGYGAVAQSAAKLEREWRARVSK